MSEIEADECDEPTSVIFFADADELLSQRTGERELSTADTELAVTIHANAVVVHGVGRLRQLRRMRSKRRGENFGWTLHVDRLVRPLVIEFLDKRIKPLLLLEEIGFRGPGCLSLERSVHSLVPTVLLRASWTNTFELDTEPKPVRRQLRQSSQADRRKRHAVVRAHHRRQTIRAKYLLAGFARRLVANRSHPFAAKDEPADLIGDRQRIAVALITEAEVAFVVDAPNVVGCDRRAQTVVL